MENKSIDKNPAIDLHLKLVCFAVGGIVGVMHAPFSNEESLYNAVRNTLTNSALLFGGVAYKVSVQDALYTTPYFALGHTVGAAARYYAIEIL